MRRWSIPMQKNSPEALRKLAGPPNGRTSTERRRRGRRGGPRERAKAAYACFGGVIGRWSWLRSRRSCFASGVNIS